MKFSIKKSKHLLIFFFTIILFFLAAYINFYQHKNVYIGVNNGSKISRGFQKVTFDINDTCKDSPFSQSGELNFQGVKENTRYIPQEKYILADKSNFGDRFISDIFGNPVKNLPLIVLHETVISASETIQLFQTPHPLDQDQASYHILITRFGEVIHLVPLEKRAFGAGNSIFFSEYGPEEVKTNSKIPASVNNFAYHIALESPPDGNNESRFHSGYTNSQYLALAWLVNKMDILESRITTHYAVDRTNSRKDPRSFDVQKFYSLLKKHRAVC